MKALILDGKVVDVVSTEFEVHSSMTWVDCADTVKYGFEYKDGKFTDPFELTDEQKAAQAAIQYKYDRKTGVGSTAGYGQITEQLDQLYHDMADGKLGAGATTGSWYVGITSVKTAFPKP